MDREMPLGVKIISVLILISAIISLFGGIYLLITGLFLDSVDDTTQIGT